MEPEGSVKVMGHVVSLKGEIATTEPILQNVAYNGWSGARFNLLILGWY